MPTLKVHRGDVSQAEVQTAWEAVLEEAALPESAARDVLEAHELDADSVATDSVEVKDADHDVGVSLLIVVGGPVAVHVLKSLWDDVVRPRLRRDTGRDAGPAISESDADS